MSGVELQGFISSSIKQIVEGIIDANMEINKKGASANPTSTSGKTNAPIIVSFDIAVAAEEQGKAQAGVAIKVFGIGASTDASLNGVNSKATRIAFNIPLQLPSGENKGYFKEPATISSFSY